MQKSEIRISNNNGSGRHQININCLQAEKSKKKKIYENNGKKSTQGMR